MAQVTFSDPIRDIRGTFTKGGIINRHKQYRDEKGRIVHESTPEAYAVRHPRNWKTNPAKGKELECQLRFKAASAETKRILMAAKPEAYPDYTPTEEDLATLHYWQERFYKQLHHPEPDAPFDPKTGQRKRYARLDAFIRTCLMRQLP